MQFNTTPAAVAGDTMTFLIDSVAYSAEVLSVDGDDDIATFKFHGSTTTIGESSNSHVVATSSTVGNITATMTTDHNIIFTGATNNTSFTLAKATAFSDGTGATGGTLSRGLVAGVMYSDISTVKGANSALATVDHAIEKINSAFENFSKKNKVIEITKEKLVSIDFNHNPASSIIDASLTNVVGKNMGKISAWYDNEWGFSNRMCDIAEYLHKIS